MITLERARELMREAIEEARKSAPEDARIHPKVGALLADREGTIIAHAYRNENGRGSHAEYIVLEEKAAGQDLSNAVLFVTHEPCTGRGPGKTACAQRVIERGIKTVYIGMLDPNPRIDRSGENWLRWSDVSVERFPHEFVEEIMSVDAAFVNHYRSSHLPDKSLYVTMQIADIICGELQKCGFDLDHVPADWGFTIDDLILYCASAVRLPIDSIEVSRLVRQVRGIAFDKKYADYTYEKDTRGLGDHWKNDVREILRLLHAHEYPHRHVINVGIGNGLEAVGLFDTVTRLTAVDIAPEV